MFLFKIVLLFLKCLLFCATNVSNVNFYKYIEFNEEDLKMILSSSEALHSTFISDSIAFKLFAAAHTLGPIRTIWKENEHYLCKNWAVNGHLASAVGCEPFK